MIRENFIRMEISLPPALHKRMKAMCKQRDLKTIDLLRNAVAEHVEFLEEKTRKEAEQRRIDRENVDGRLKFTSFRRMSRSNLTPPARPAPIKKNKPDETNAPAQAPVPPPPKELPIEYAQYAEKIYAAIHDGSTLEARLRTMEAVSAIKKRYPISAPKNDAAIVSILERLVVAMQEAAVKTREETPEVTIDTSKIRTFGDVASGEGEA